MTIALVLPQGLSQGIQYSRTDGKLLLHVCSFFEFGPTGNHEFADKLLSHKILNLAKFLLKLSIVIVLRMSDAHAALLRMGARTNFTSPRLATV